MQKWAVQCSCTARTSSELSPGILQGWGARFLSPSLNLGQGEYGMPTENSVKHLPGETGKFLLQNPVSCPCEVCMGKLTLLWAAGTPERQGMWSLWKRHGLDSKGPKAQLNLGTGWGAFLNQNAPHMVHSQVHQPKTEAELQAMRMTSVFWQSFPTGLQTYQSCGIGAEH